MILGFLYVTVLFGTILFDPFFGAWSIAKIIMKLLWLDYSVYVAFWCILTLLFGGRRRRIRTVEDPEILMGSAMLLILWTSYSYEEAIYYLTLTYQILCGIIIVIVVVCVFCVSFLFGLARARMRL